MHSKFVSVKAFPDLLEIPIRSKTFGRKGLLTAVLGGFATSLLVQGPLRWTALAQIKNRSFEKVPMIEYFEKVERHNGMEVK